MVLIQLAANGASMMTKYLYFLFSILLLTYSFVTYAKKATTLQVGDKVLVEWQQKWYPAEIVAKGKYKWKIHYDGYSNSWDEWVDEQRIKPQVKTQNSQQSSSLQKNFLLEEIVEVKWHGYWYPAKILRKDKVDQFYIHFIGMSDQWNEWVGFDRIRKKQASQSENKKSTTSTNEYQYKKGETVKVKWKNAWYRAKIIETKNEAWKVHFIGYSNKWDQWVTRHRIRTNDFRRPQYEPVIHSHKLDLGLNQIVIAEWNGKWFPAKVIEKSSDKWKVHYIGYDNYWNEWLDSGRIQIIGKTSVQSKNKLNPQIKQFFQAAKNNNLQELEYLINQGIKIDSKNLQGATILHIAVKNKNQPLVAFILAQGADINHQDAHSQTALMWAASLWDWNLVKYLLKNNANPNLGRSALYYAIQSGQVEIVKLFIAKGINVNHELVPGLTPLQLAENFHQKNIIHLLIDAGAINTKQLEHNIKK